MLIENKKERKKKRENESGREFARKII